MNAGTSYEKAKRQAQANADTTGKDWVLFTSGGSFQVEQDWATRAFEAEVFRPSPYPKKDCIHPSGLTYAPGASSRACVFCGAHEEDVKSWAPRGDCRQLRQVGGERPEVQGEGGRRRMGGGPRQPLDPGARHPSGAEPGRAQPLKRRRRP